MRIVLLTFFVSLFLLLFSASPANALYEDDCRPRGGRCVSKGSVCPRSPLVHKPDRRFSCPQKSQQCCMPPRSCESRGGEARSLFSSGKKCGGRAELLPNPYTASSGLICCRRPSSINRR